MSGDLTSQGQGPPRSDRKTAIVDAAVKVFSHHGFDAGTIRQIATEAGVAEGLIYHYFDSKEALFDAIIRERSILSWLARRQGPDDDAPVEAALRAVATEALARMQQNADLMAIVWSQAATNRALAERVGDVFQEITGRIAAYLDRKIARGELRPVNTTVAARMLAGALMHFAMFQARLSPPLEPISPQDYVDGMLDLALRGLIPPEGSDADAVLSPDEEPTP
jgi:AcrR family transcriptional regulator